MQNKSNKLLNVVCGHLGEDIVIAELTRHNYIASRLDDRTKLFDIIVMNEAGTKFCAIQVKTNQKGSNRFPLNVKNEKYSEEQNRCFYAFVKLKSHKNSEDEIYFVPFKEVAECISKGHQEWLNEPGKSGQEHKDTSIRNFTIDENRHKNFDFSVLDLD